MCGLINKQSLIIHLMSMPCIFILKKSHLRYLDINKKKCHTWERLQRNHSYWYSLPIINLSTMHLDNSLLHIYQLPFQYCWLYFPLQDRDVLCVSLFKVSHCPLCIADEAFDIQHSNCELLLFLLYLQFSFIQLSPGCGLHNM